MSRPHPQTINPRHAHSDDVQLAGEYTYLGALILSPWMLQCHGPRMLSPWMLQCQGLILSPWTNSKPMDAAVPWAKNSKPMDTAVPRTNSKAMDAAVPSMDKPMDAAVPWAK